MCANSKLGQTGNTGSRIARGSIILVTSQALILVCQFGGDLILARLLSPNQFGTIAMVLVISNFALQFQDLGLSSATVQRQGLTVQQSSNLFWCNLSLGILFALIVMITAPILDLVYHRQGLAILALPISTTLIFAGASAQFRALLIKETRFRSVAISRLSGVIISYVVAVFCAHLGLGVWALVILYVVRYPVSLISLIISYPWLPRLPKRGHGTLNLIKFGGNVAGFDLINYISRNADNFLIGRYYGDVVLGFYGRAYNLLILLTSQIRGPISAAGMPLLATLQDQHAEYRRIFLGMVSLVAFVAIPTNLLMCVYAREIVTILFGDKWIASSQYLRYLTLAGAVQPTIGMLGLLLVTRGSGTRYFRWGCWHSCTIVVGFIIGANWGAEGIAVSYGVSNLILAIPSIWYCTSGSPIPPIKFVKAHNIPIGFSSAAFVSLILIERATQVSDNILRLTIGCGVFFAVYFLQFLFMRSRREDLKTLYSQLFRTNRR